MQKKSTYIIYLHPSVANDDWAFLHRFFHPGILNHDKKQALVGFLLGTSHHYFLSVTARNFSNKGSNRRIHVPYGMILAMIELPQKFQLGFLPPEESFDKLKL